jgi:hypothetical protein
MQMRTDPTNDAVHSGILTRTIKWLRRDPSNRTVCAEFNIHDFDTPAKGDAYDFVVTISGAWTARGRFPDGTLDEFIKDNWAETVEIIHTTVREHARKFPPHEPAKAEGAINDALCHVIPPLLARRHQDAACELSFSVRALVSMCDPVRVMQGEVWGQILRRDAGFELAEQLRGLRTLWGEVLRGALGDWTERYAIQLAEKPSQTTEVITDMLGERRRAAEQQLVELNKTVTQHQDIDMLDFVLQTDSALRAIMMTLGVPLPDSVPVSPFTNIADK